MVKRVFKQRVVSGQEIFYFIIVSDTHIFMLYPEGTTSVTPTMLRLISPFGESDGRFVHTINCDFNNIYYL